MHGRAKEQSEIDSEKEIVETSTVQAMGKNKYGNVIQNELQEKLNSNTGEGKTEVIDDGDTLVVKFINSRRYYEVDNDGNVESIEVIVDAYAGDLTKGGRCDGSEEKPIEINCIEDLVEFSIATNGGNNFSGKYVILIRTLDFNSIFSYNDFTITKYGDLNTNGVIEDIKTELTMKDDNCLGFAPINTFQGNFDGQGNEIQNIYINRDGKAAFIIMNNSLVSAENIKNLGITGNITSKNNFAAGIMVSDTAGSKGANIIENCYNKANVKTVSGITVAGICVGSGMTINNCYNEGNITNEANSSGQAGGIVAGAGGENIENCYNTGDITGIKGTW